MELKNGQVYRLTRDVTNPAPDRRGKNFRRGHSVPTYQWAEKMETWPKGMRFRYVEQDDERRESAEIHNFDGELRGRITPVIWDPKDRNVNRRIPNPQWTALVAALEPVPEDFSTFMATIDDTALRCADTILEMLFDRGIVTKDHVREMYAELQRQWDAEQWDAEQAEMDARDAERRAERERTHCATCRKEIPNGALRVFRVNEVGALQHERYCSEACAEKRLAAWTREA